MDKPFLFPKQLEALRQGNGKKIKAYVGSVRSGKSVSVAVEAVNMALNAPPGPLLFMARTLANVHSNICQTIRDVFGEGYLDKASEKATHVNLLGRRVRCVGADNVSEAEKIKGLNLSGIICDEITTFPKAVFSMAITRLNAEGARLIGSTNPDAPTHWFKKDYLSRAIDSFCELPFRVDDNPLLTEEYKQLLRQTLRGAFFKRYYLGEWAAADGLIYSDFGDHLISDCADLIPQEIVCGIDFGLQHKTEAVLVASSHLYQPRIWVPKAISIDQNPLDVQTVSEVARQLVDWMSPNFPKTIYVDPSALVLRTELRRHLPRGVTISNAKNDVQNGIHYVSRLFCRQEITIDHSCKQLIDELYSYCWDETKSARSGKDEVKKENDDGVDALRYAIYSRFGSYADPVREARDVADLGIAISKRLPAYKQMLRENYHGFV